MIDKNDKDAQISKLKAENLRLIALLSPQMRPFPKGWPPEKEKWDVIAQASFDRAAHLPED